MWSSQHKEFLEGRKEYSKYISENSQSTIENTSSVSFPTYSPKTETGTKEYGSWLIFVIIYGSILYGIVLIASKIGLDADKMTNWMVQNLHIVLFGPFLILIIIMVVVSTIESILKKS